MEDQTSLKNNEALGEDCEDKSRSFTAEASDAGARIDLFVAERVDLTRSASQKLVEKGAVTVNGRTVAKNYKLRAEDLVEVMLPEPVPYEAAAEDIPLDIIYEDDDLIIVNKPKGMVVHPAAGNYTGTMVNALLHHCGDSLSGINGVIRPGIVHRIDKDTSGLLVVAKNDTAHISLAAQIAEHSFERCYRAVVIGNLKEDSGRIDAPIARHPIDRKKMAIVAGGRNAATNYRVIERFVGFTYAEFRLETGRTHQIRIHMAHIGHPLLGDTVYGSGKNKFEQQNAKILCGQCLHAKTISFVHPRTGELMRFDSPIPDYMQTILKKLGGKTE
ncbi:MAG: RluA family pseudouridine synthase [Clostridia bacterium]|nr:RluA family pseudouridine synthase [Clostridia bacterium]